VPNEKGTDLIENPYHYWNEINPRLPKRKITVYGPPISSGTRDSFEEIVLQYQTEEMKVYRDAGLKGYRIIRTDGVFIPAGENDNLIVQKITKDKEALGVFGYSFLAENADKIVGVQIDKITPTIMTISNKSYPIARSLFFYVKNDHHAQVPAMREYIDLFLSSEMIGQEGLLTEIGLIPMHEDQIAVHRKRAEIREVLDVDMLEKALAAR
jgi:phosphate transport system substrate-binding protein